MSEQAYLVVLIEIICDKLNICDEIKNNAIDSINKIFEELENEK